MASVADPTDWETRRPVEPPISNQIILKQLSGLQEFLKSHADDVYGLFAWLKPDDQLQVTQKIDIEMPITHHKTDSSSQEGGRIWEGFLHAHDLK